MASEVERVWARITGGGPGGYHWQELLPIDGGEWEDGPRSGTGAINRHRVAVPAGAVVDAELDDAGRMVFGYDEGLCS